MHYSHPYAQEIVRVLKQNDFTVITKGGPYEVVVMQYDKTTRSTTQVVTSFTVHAKLDASPAIFSATYDGMRLRFVRMIGNSATLTGRREFARWEHAAPEWDLRYATEGYPIDASKSHEDQIEQVGTITQAMIAAFVMILG